MNDRIQGFEFPLILTSSCVGKKSLDREQIKTGVLAALQSQVKRHLANQFLKPVSGLYGKKGAIINTIAKTQKREDGENWGKIIRDQYEGLKRQWSSDQISIVPEKDEEVQRVLESCAEAIESVLSNKGYVFVESAETPRHDVTATTPKGIFVSLQRQIQLIYCDTDRLFSLAEIASGIADKLYAQFESEFNSVAQKFAEKFV